MDPTRCHECANFTWVDRNYGKCPFRENPVLAREMAGGCVDKKAKKE